MNGSVCVPACSFFVRGMFVKGTPARRGEEEEGGEEGGGEKERREKKKTKKKKKKKKKISFCLFSVPLVLCAVIVCIRLTGGLFWAGGIGWLLGSLVYSVRLSGFQRIG